MVIFYSKNWLGICQRQASVGVIYIQSPWELFTCFAVPLNELNLFRQSHSVRDIFPLLLSQKTVKSFDVSINNNGKNLNKLLEIRFCAYENIAEI